MSTLRRFFMLLVPIIGVGYVTTGCNGGGSGGGGDVTGVIVCIGDSITRGFGATPYPSILAGITSAERVVNAGVDGATSSSGPARIGGLLSQHNPEVVCIMFGANDVINGISPEVTVGNLKATVDAVKAFGARAIVGQVTPQTGSRAGNAGGVRAINSMLGGVGAPIAGTFGAVGDNLSDGLHPNDIGQSGIAGAFADKL